MDWSERSQDRSRRDAAGVNSLTDDTQKIRDALGRLAKLTTVVVVVVVVVVVAMNHSVGDCVELLNTYTGMGL
ncbi:hypothetical protein EX30DRAFT_344715 [Ascodesmis nigricans]|uniref:Uncharacterized protein n=1 Tax=Ascodesmis nigricans TaxID=341454 RepID=A0A4S2MIC0_9PEZI|nr:hypothetical protein EX30DRAFT_344715 [Ascodesmis nigricans]